MLGEFIHLTPIEGALGNGKESLVNFDLHKWLLWVTGMLVNMCPQHTVAAMAKKYIVFSYDMLSQLFSGFGTHGSGCKRKTFPVCWECASCSVLNNTVLLYSLVARTVGGKIIENWCPWKSCTSSSTGIVECKGSNAMRLLISLVSNREMFMSSRGVIHWEITYFLWPLRYHAANLCHPTLKPLISFNVYGHELFCHCFGS